MVDVKKIVCLDRFALKHASHVGHLGRSRDDLDFASFTHDRWLDGEPSRRDVKTSRRTGGVGGAPFTLRNYSQFIIQCQIIVPWQVLRRVRGSRARVHAA